jgi:glucose-6-phosphate dehydrogenase assembly protein OpcA
VAQPVTATVVARRSLADTDADGVEAALAALRRTSERAAVRTAVCTLVALADTDRCAAVLDTAARLAATHPVHCLAVVPGDPDGPARIDAEVRVHCQALAEHTVCTEDVRLEVAGPAVDHLDSLVEPLALPDLPVALWYPGSLPTPDDPLLAVADRLILDTKEIGEATAFPAVAALCRRYPVADLSWARLTPWRELLAGLFEGDAFRPFLAGVEAISVAGKPAPSRLMAGWVLSRLGLGPEVATVTDHVHVSIELVASHAGRTGRFAVTRRSDERIVTASAVVRGGPAHERALRLRPRDPARVHGEVLARTGHDPVYEQALAAAIALAP